MMLRLNRVISLNAGNYAGWVTRAVIARAFDCAVIIVTRLDKKLLQENMHAMKSYFAS